MSCSPDKLGNLALISSAQASMDPVLYLRCRRHERFQQFDIIMMQQPARYGLCILSVDQSMHIQVSWHDI